MPTIDIRKITAGLSPTWSGYLRDWDRTLRAANHPETTRYSYLLAAAQLGRYLAQECDEFDAPQAADDPCLVGRGHVEGFQAWMVDTRSASTALNKHKSLQQFFKWLTVDEEAIRRSPMDRVRQPKTPEKLVPVLTAEETRKLLAVCGTASFVDLRDQALIRLFYNTGGRLAEVGNLTLDDLDLHADTVRFHGKGAKDRRVRIGPRTGRAISRYLRARSGRRGADLPHLWLSARGACRLEPNGIKIRLKQLGAAAGVANVHAHRWRHSFAHEWKLAGGDTGDLMLLLGWSSDDMPRHYGASAAAERAQQTQARLAIGERV
ncbi:tyrosine-type recombinase/integrase [Asanoa sp. NPDC049573]|uniref:tyrosine-type recombinase/integrase n=1 Tax=Asanoa sp. NPDC049573 TaxID=3155396 RepID=UPI00343A691F